METVVLTLVGHMPHYKFAIILVQKKGMGYWDIGILGMS